MTNNNQYMNIPAEKFRFAKRTDLSVADNIQQNPGKESVFGNGILKGLFPGTAGAEDQRRNDALVGIGGNSAFKSEITGVAAYKSSRPVSEQIAPAAVKDEKAVQTGNAVGEFNKRCQLD